MRKLLVLVVVLVLVGTAFSACGVSPNPLIGEWRVYKIQGPDGNIVETPPPYDLRMVYDDKRVVTYEPGKSPQTLRYVLASDETGPFIKVTWNGTLYGQRFTVLEDGDIRWDLFEPGTNRPSKMWMTRTTRPAPKP